MSNYWNRTLTSRRTALRGAAAAVGGVAALSLIGCGGGSKSSSSSGTSKPETGNTAVTDSTKGKSGGTFKFMLTGPLTSLGLVDSNFTGNQRLGGLVHSGLLGFRWGQESVPYTDFSFEGDLAQALPEQSDPQTLVYKLRPGVKFHNGRALVADDVKYSYDRYANYDRSVYKGAWQNWYDKTETPDPQTVVVKTKFPFADALESTAAMTDGYILAKEHEESPAVNERMMGTGPFIFASMEPPTSWNLKKNPDYFLKPYPYFDEFIVYTTTDTVKRISNFTTGQVDMPWLVYADDRENIKQQRPNAKLESYDFPSSSIFMRTDKAPFNDKRVRQALSMTIDRKKIRDAVQRGEGIDEQYFPSAFANVYGTHTVKDLGDNSKYWAYNPAEAKKLMSAAGIDKPIEANVSHYDASVLGQFYVDQIVLTQAGWKDNGIANVKLINLLGPQMAAGPRLGNYDGMAVTTSSLTLLQRGTNLRQMFYWGPNGEHSAVNYGYINDPQLSKLADLQVTQLKDEDRKQSYRAMEQIIAENQYQIIWSSTKQTWFWNEALRNVSVPTQQGNMRYAMRWWFA